MRDRLLKIVRQPHLWFLAIGSFFGVASVFLMPVFTIPDEGTHFWLSYGMFSKKEYVPQDLLVPADVVVQKVNNDTYVRDLFTNKVNFEGDSFSFNLRKDIYLRTETADRSLITSSLDINHLPQAIGILIGKLIYPSVGVMMILGRLINLAVYIALIYLIIKNVRYGKIAFAFIALFPMMIQQAGSLSYDSINAIAIFAWIALMINIFTQKFPLTSRQLLLGVLIGIALVLTKFSNILLLSLLIFIPPRLYTQTRLGALLYKFHPVRFKKRTLTLIAIALAVVLTTTFTGLLYIYLHNHGINGSQFAEALFNTYFRPEVNQQLDPIITSGIVGNFGWLWYRLPEWLVIVHLMVLLVVLLGERIPVGRLFAIISGGLFIVSVLAITFGMYFVWTVLPFVGGLDAKFVQGMQGRYFTPLLVLLIPPFAYLQRHISIKASRESLAALTIVMAIVSLSVYMLLTYIFFYTPATGVKDILL